MEDRKKRAIERLKANGRYDEFKKALKAGGKDAWVLFHESGQVVILGDEGRRFTKTARTLFDSDNQKVEVRAFTPNTERMVGAVVEFLRKEGVKLKDDLTDMPLSGKKLRQSNQFDRDSKLDLAVRYLEAADIALDEKCTMETRLAAAYALGDIWRCMVVNNFYGQTQKKIAKQERKKGLSAIFEKLRAMKTTGAKPKELWPEFISMLQEENQTFDQVVESSPNPANCNTWSVQFLIIPDKDSEKEKEETMKYNRFVRRLSEK